MIIGSWVEMKIGEIFNGGIFDEDKKLHEGVRYMILEEVTVDDWVRSYEVGKLSLKDELRARLFASSGKAKFYRISVD